MDSIVRFGSYGVIVEDSKILLVYKKSGPYKGLWDFPGGAIEFGESPEEALLRELQEEAGLSGDCIEFFSTANFLGEFFNQEDKYRFHHVGFIYKVWAFSALQKIAEEEMRWISLDRIQLEEMTPFVQQICIKLNPIKKLLGTRYLES